MGKLFRTLLLAMVVTAAAAVSAQDKASPSLGDLARQQREQKSKVAPDKSAKTAKVITNEELPSHTVAVSAPASSGGDSEPPRRASAEGKMSAGEWTSQIREQKSQISALQKQVEDVHDSIRFAPANCRGNCVEWNERQREKQQQVERMQGQLEEQKKQLGEMQEAARRQGYGSAVYDPD
jgi:hypothetical protein